MFELSGYHEDRQSVYTYVLIVYTCAYIDAIQYT